MNKIGIIEDDEKLNAAIRIYLEKAGFWICSATDVKGGLRLLAMRPDLILLDLNLPDGSGFRVSHKSKDIPVIFLTGRDEERDMIRAYDDGCEDYIVKPFSMEVLKRRIQVVMRRTGKAPDVLNYKQMSIDFEKKRVTVCGKPLSITAKEYKLLEYLARNQGQVLSKEMILERIWDIDGQFVVENTVSVTIGRIKRKIELVDSENEYIKNVFGMGYVFGA